MARSKKTKLDLNDARYDIEILCHARTFGLADWRRKTAQSSSMIAGVYITDRHQAEAAKRLAGQGLLTRVDRGTFDRYEITDAGLVACRAHEERDDLTVDVARRTHDSELRRIWGDDPIAKRQLELRASGTTIVRGALLACGERHHGTGGWHLLACVDDLGRLGWVDTAKGHAYLSTATLDAEMIEALTVPDQPEGAVGSGTSHVTARTAGSSGVECPDGWRQLVVDIRVVEGDLATEDVTATLVAWGLVTCYGHRRGDPVGRWGDRQMTLSGRESSLSDDHVAQIRSSASAMLATIERSLLDRAGLDAEPGCSTRNDSRHWDVTEVTTTSFHESITHEAIREAGVGRIAAAAGEYDPNRCRGARTIDRISRTVALILQRRLEPVYEALGPVGSEPTSLFARGTVRDTVRDVLRKAGLAQAEHELARVADMVVADEAELVRTLYQYGAVVTCSGRDRGVSCTRPPARPIATRIEIGDGVEAYHVPFGAEYPSEFDHVLVLTVDHQIRCRSTDRDRALPHALGLTG